MNPTPPSRPRSAAVDVWDRPWPAWKVAAWTFVLLAAVAWIRPLLLPDEGRYAGVAWAMLQGGDFLTPHVAGLPFFHKPPLTYWVTSAGFALLGPLGPVGFGIAARLAPLVGATIGLVALHALLQARLGPGVAHRAALLLMSFPMWAVGAQYANLDMLVAGLITAAVCCGARAVWALESGAAPRRALLGLYGCAALAMLAKGLIGFVLPAAALGAWLMATGRWRAMARLLADPPGWALALVVAAPWFVAMQLRHPEFFDYFFVEQHFRRFTSRYVGATFNNVHPAWIYVPVLGVLCFPLWPGLVALWRERREALAGSRRDLALLFGLWTVAIVGFFSVPSSKLVGYVLPAVPALAGLAALGLQAWAARSPRTGRRALHWPVGLGVLATLVAVAALTLAPPRSYPQLGQALRQQHLPGQPVWWLDDAFHDVSVIARLEQPPRVVSPWDDPSIGQSDDWRRELLEAGRFDPPAAAERLVRPQALPARLCAVASPDRVHWLLGGEDAPVRFPAIQGAVAVARERGRVLWRWVAPQPCAPVDLPHTPAAPGGPASG